MAVRRRDESVLVAGRAVRDGMEGMRGTRERLAGALLPLLPSSPDHRRDDDDDDDDNGEKRERDGGGGEEEETLGGSLTRGSCRTRAST